MSQVYSDVNQLYIRVLVCLIACSAVSQVYSDVNQLYIRVLNCFSHISLFPALWTAAHQAPLSMAFLRQEYWSGLLCPSPVDCTNKGKYLFRY